MNSNEWQTIQEIFHHVITLPIEQRGTYIDQQCKNNSHLHQEVTSLLTHHEKSTEIDSIIDYAAHCVVNQTSQKIGDVVDRYRLIEMIGQGGMGDIYLAERADEHYTQRVAIKINRNALTTADRASRFKTERQILANLEHPNIARLLDGGTTETNQPYLVMEYIEGTPIDLYCQQKKLGLHEQLRLFQKVCDAVQYAHQHLVVHCDLKPSNILITLDGEPKLLDFGISRLLDQQESSDGEQSLEANEAERLLSLHYSSPEQICGDPLSTSTDIYSLGVILYKLLTQQLPYEHVTDNLHDAIVEFTPAPPSQLLTRNKSTLGNSTQVEPSVIKAKDIAGDLDAILLKALHNRASLRYKSVNQFSNDLERFVNHFPVTAHRNSWVTRSKKFLRRNRLSSSLAAFILITMTTTSSAIFIQSQRIALERDIAEQERGKAVAITDFLHNMFFSINPDDAQGEVITVRQILDKASEKLNQDDSHTLFSQPLIEASVRRTIGDIYFRLGVIHPAIGHLERALTLHREHQTDDAEFYRVLRALSNSYNRADKFDLQRPILEESIDVAKRIFGEHDEKTLGVMSNLAGLYNDTGNSFMAINLHNEIYDKSLNALGPANIVTILAITSLGADYYALGDYQKAEEYFQQGLEACLKEWNENHGLALYNLAGVGYVLERLGQFEAGYAPTKKRLERAIHVLGEQHQDTLDAKLSMGRIHLGLGEYSQAEALFNDILTALPNRAGELHALNYVTRFALAELYLKTDRAAQALPLAQSTLTLAKDVWADDNLKILFGTQVLADALTANQEYQNAITHYQHILTSRQQSIDKEQQQNKLLEIEHLQVKYIEAYYAHLGLARVYLALEQNANSTEHLRSIVRLTQAHPRMTATELPWVLTSLLTEYEGSGKTKQASTIRAQLVALDQRLP
ncbi:protein kinase [Paraglaciecola chathamensis]|uniref:Protein kinase n=1 Tax=Paraglaciecola chathamensis TaxID=368405 RepID=A0ABS0WDP6_9ALTE|nr:serine/threonine-protein kinase [Paraglaciecola chathamensis]MBJ2136590.1 protein kinase [Paraglaciecola chathamensis]